MPEGRCACGAVRFEVTGTLSQIELCHCVKCRRAYGAAFAATLYARLEAFRWLAGADRVTTWDAPLETRPPAYRHAFCRSCGSPLPFDVEGLALVEIPAALLDDASGARPAYHLFVSQQAPWHEIADALPRHERGGAPADKVLRRLL